MEFKEEEIIKLPETREVLFEKFGGEDMIKQIDMQEFFYNKLDCCQIIMLEECPNSFFFIKKATYLFEIYNFDEKEQKQKSKNGYFCVRYDEIWSVFESRYGLNYQQIQVFIQGQVEKLLKLNGFTPSLLKRFSQRWWKSS